MRARLALRSAEIEVDLREILLRDKPAAFLDISKTQTVPVLVLADGAATTIGILEAFDAGCRIRQAARVRAAAVGVRAALAADVRGRMADLLSGAVRIRAAFDAVVVSQQTDHVPGAVARAHARSLAGACG